MAFWSDPRRRLVAQIRAPQVGDKACVDCMHYDRLFYDASERCRAPQNEKSETTYSWTHGKQTHKSCLFFDPGSAREAADGCGPDGRWFEAGESHAKRNKREEQEALAARWCAAEDGSAALLEEVRTNGT